MSESVRTIGLKTTVPPLARKPIRPDNDGSSSSLPLDGFVSGERGLSESSLKTSVLKDGPSRAPIHAPPSVILGQTQRLSLFQRVGRSLLSFLGGNRLERFQADLKAINALEAEVADLKTPSQFQAKTSEFRRRLKQGETLDDIRNEAYAVARQAARVETGMRAYDCQVLGALAMNDGHIAEMRTGEGKTLTAVMPLYLNALAGKGAHLVTVNDTLAQRDRDSMGPVFERLGLTCGCVLEGMTAEEKRAGYNSDITYTTDRALGFDYLRDKTARNPNSRVQREPYFALIDEVDEVLIDEARTPMIISGLARTASPDFHVFDEIVKDLKPGLDFYAETEDNTIWLTDTGTAWVENRLAIRELEHSDRPDKAARIAECEAVGRAIREEQKAFAPLRELREEKPNLLERLGGESFDSGRLEALEAEHARKALRRKELSGKAHSYNLYSQENLHRTRYLNAALRARHLLLKDQDYIVTDNGVEIVDENRGRTSQGRRFNDGIHQALEAKEGVPVQDEQRTVATITYPNLFKRYPRLSGMSGTAATSATEFGSLYNLDVVEIPTNKPVIRQDLPDLMFPTAEEKYKAVARDAARDFFEGRPVLVGTLSVEHNRYMAQALIEAGIPEQAIQVLNADSVRGDKRLENEIIANAGRSGTITVATNMAGRGANIKPDLVNFQQLSLRAREIVERGGSVRVELDKEKDAAYLSQWLPDLAPTLDGKALVLGQGEAELLRGADFPTGGLTVYGTARGETARVDNQLIGRAGRQGAPGRSRFYLSAEDDLMRHLNDHQQSRLRSLLAESAGRIEGERVREFVNRAQAITEGNAFAAREKTTKRDDLINHQRDAYFGYRDELLTSGPAITEQFGEMVGLAMLDAMMGKHLDQDDRFRLEEVKKAARETSKELRLPMALPLLEKGPSKVDAEDLEQEIREYAQALTDWTLQRMSLTTPNVPEALRKELIAITDVSWSEHLDNVEVLQDSVGWQVMAQKDPEVEFKLQAHEAFEDTVSRQRYRAAGVFLPHLLDTARQIDLALQKRQAG